MRPRALFLPLLVAGALAVAPAGCGDGESTAEQAEGGSTQPSADYRELLTGVRRAAEANTGYEALSRAEALAPPEQAALEAFCEIVWKVDVNQDGDVSKGPAIPAWIRGYAESNLGVAYMAGKARLPALSAALAELDSTLDLGSLDAELSKRYKRACYT